MQLIQQNTPIEQYIIQKQAISVKREDMACLPPGPSFSKIRGLYKRLCTLKDQGIKTVGYPDTAVSMAGWGVSYLAKELGLKAIIFDPQYRTNDPSLAHMQLLNFHRGKWKEFGADVIPVEASKFSILSARCKKIFEEKFPKDSCLLPMGLPFEETIEEVSKEAARIKGFKTVIVPVGSGTICAGVLRGIQGQQINLIGVTSTRRDAKAASRIIMKRANVPQAGLLSSVELQVFSTEYSYSEPELMYMPFPCHPFYDAKAWSWLTKNIAPWMKTPILFWNIGCLPEEFTLKLPRMTEQKKKPSKNNI